MSIHSSTAEQRAADRASRPAPGKRTAIRGSRRTALCGLAPVLALATGLVIAAIPPVESPVPGRSAGIDRARDALEGGDLRILQGRQISLDEAIDMAQRRYNARVVRAEVSERDGRRVYVLRLLSDDGRVFNVRVDAATGAMQ